MKLYEYAVLFTPLQTRDQLERGEKPKTEIIVAITSVVAGNDKECQMVASRSIPEKYQDKLDQVEIAIRPF